MISIIVPIYNAGQYLCQCIDSIIAQTYSDWELLLVDDGSTDSSGDLCDSYARKDSRIKVFHKVNGGVSSSRNLGLNEANGDVITFADSDDWLEPNAFQTYMDAFRNNHVDVVKTGFYHEHENGVSERNIIPETEICTNTWDMFRITEKCHYYSFVWNTCIRRECIGGNRFNEELCWLEDHTFIYECYLNCRRMAILNAATYHYVRRNENSLAHIKDPDIVKKAADIELTLKKKLLGGHYSSLEQEAESIYAYRIHSVVLLSYSGRFSYTKRKAIAEQERLVSNLKYKEEKVFFSKWIPFFLRDSLLRILFTLKRKR